MMRGRRSIQVFAWRVHMPKISELSVDFRMRGKMKRIRIIGAVLIPAPDLVCNRRRRLQSESVQKRIDLFACRGARQFLVGYRSNDFVTHRAITEGERRSQKRQK